MRYCMAILAALPLLAQETILLRPGTKIDPSVPHEQLEERGKNGVVDRSITRVAEPSVTVYLPKVPFDWCAPMLPSGASSQTPSA